MFVIIPKQSVAAEVGEERNLRGHIDDLEGIIGFNEFAQEVMERKDSGRPGHYWGRNTIIEASMPMAAFLLAPLEYGDDQDWWKDDKKFQEFMKRHPKYNWLERK